MKTGKPVFIEGHIVANRLTGEVNQPFCIHRVKFSNEKYAIVRALSGICFNPGQIIERLDGEWFCNHTRIQLLSFEYLEEKESGRQFLECY